MSITIVLLAALLAGLGTFTMHPNSVSGGGPTSAAPPTSVSGVAGGGPTTAAPPASVDGVAGGGPVG